MEIINIVDDHSRYAIASLARTVFKAADVVTAFVQAADRHQPPAIGSPTMAPSSPSAAAAAPYKPN